MSALLGICASWPPASSAGPTLPHWSDKARCTLNLPAVQNGMSCILLAVRVTATLAVTAIPPGNFCPGVFASLYVAPIITPKFLITRLHDHILCRK